MVPGRNPLVQLAPLLVDVAHPMSLAPPSGKRPVWNTPTTVEPNENVSGSSSVWWKLLVFVYGSVLTWVTGTANAGSARAIDPPMTTANTADRTMKRVPR